MIKINYLRPFALCVFAFAIFMLAMTTSIIGQESGASKKSRKIYERSDNPVLISLANGANSKMDETSAIAFDSGILYISNKANSSSIPALYYAPVDASGKFSTDKLFTIGSAMDKLESGLATTSRNDQIFYTAKTTFSANGKPAPNAKLTNKIFQSIKSGGKWSNGKVLSICMDNYNTSQPTLSSDGMNMYFSSDRPGGFGGMDLYVSAWNGKVWSTPVNLGKNVNSNRDEIFPFVDGDDVLYFSSNGRKGQGGFDIYYTLLEDVNKFVPVTIGDTINSKKDDLGFQIGKNSESGYFFSNRDGGTGGKDIYMWKIK